MKLLYITPHISGAGGVERVLSVKTNYLVKQGYKVSILITNPDKDEVIYTFNQQIDFYTIAPDRNNYFFSYKKLLKKKISEVNPDIVIMCDNGLKSFLLPLFLSKKYKLVYERHNTKHIIDIESTKKNILNRYINKLYYLYMDYCAKRFDKFIVLSHDAKKEWPGVNAAVIPNPLWIQNNKEKSTLNNKIVIAVGRHTYQKGYDRMFAVWNKVIESFPDWKLKIYGDFNENCDLKKLAIAYKISDSIEFIPPAKDIIEAYTQASLLLMTSRHEGFGMVLIEAMACGLPCIAFDCPVGLSEIIQDGKNGFLVTDGDIESFMLKTELLLNSKDIREKTALNAQHDIEKFHLNKIMPQWDFLFRELIN